MKKTIAAPVAIAQQALSVPTIDQGDGCLRILSVIGQVALEPESRPSSSKPRCMLFGDWLAPGAHVNAVGAPRPDWRELDDEVLRNAKLYVESREAAARESGDVIAAGCIYAELGEVVNDAKEGRRSADERTLFKSVGVAVEDLASAERVYRAALAAQHL